LLLVLLLGLSILLISEARDPRNFQWLWTMGQGRGADASRTGSSEAKVPDKPPQGQSQEEEIPGTFISPSSEATTEETTSTEYFPGVKPQYLGQIQDNSPHLGREHDAWFHLLGILEENSAETLEKASVGRVTFVQLFQQPDQYRGELLTVRGTLRRTEHLAAPSNEYGFSHIYRVVLQPEDNPQYPIFAYVLELPKAMPTGMEIEEDVRITGFFFKLWEYEAQRDLLTAPVVLAKGVKWLPRPSVGPGSGQASPSPAVVIAVAAGFALLVSLYVYYRTRLQPVQAPGSLAASRMFTKEETPADIGRQLRELAQNQDSSER
jgi:hypothetical protein